MVTLRIDTPEEMPTVVEQVLKALAELPQDKAHVVALHGDLGVGKTTFTQYLAQQLGVTEAVNSPTFVLMKGYETPNGQYEKLVHIDVYRTDSPVEMVPLKFANLLEEPRTLICIEWAEKIKDLLPPETVHVRFAHIDKSRVITIEHGN